MVEIRVIDNEDVASYLLVSLPSSYENLLNHIESFVVGKESLTLEGVKVAL